MKKRIITFIGAIPDTKIPATTIERKDGSRNVNPTTFTSDFKCIEELERKIAPQSDAGFLD